MADFFEIKSIKKEDQKKILDEILKRIEEKKKKGVFTDKEIQEIAKMELHPLPDILDVQSVYESFLYGEDSSKKSD
jgi:2-oxo-4-hydroxy-4-carboxy--5-ureidoimidazoline (OHCU) decarboxylase